MKRKISVKIIFKKFALINSWVNLRGKKVLIPYRALLLDNALAENKKCAKI